MTRAFAIDSAASLPGRLITAGARLVAGGGVRAATARAVADAAGASPSAINYSFGSRSGLIHAVFEQAQADAAARARRSLGDLDGLALRPEMLGDWLAAWLHCEAVEARDLIRLRRELFIQTERLPELVEIARAWRRVQRGFARGVLDRFGLADRPEAPLDEAMRAFADCFPAQAAPAAHSAWAGSAMRHLAARLAGLPPPPSGWREVIEARAAARAPVVHALPEPAERILDGAIRLLARVGGGALSHRALARESGVSLAATTHYFDSRAAILRAAFERLYMKLSAQAQTLAPDEGALTIKDFAAGLAEASVGPGGAINTDIAAFDELLATACRDPALEPLATHLIAARGATAAAALSRMTGAAEPGAMREDAFALSLMGIAAIADLRLTPPQHRIGEARTLAELRLGVFMGPARPG